MARLRLIPNNRDNILVVYHFYNIGLFFLNDKENKDKTRSNRNVSFSSVRCFSFFWHQQPESKRIFCFFFFFNFYFWFFFFSFSYFVLASTSEIDWLDRRRFCIVEEEEKCSGAAVECQNAGVSSFIIRKMLLLLWRKKMEENTYADHPNKGGRAQTSPKHQAKMRRPLARLRVILREYCIGRTMAKYLPKQQQ